MVDNGAWRNEKRVETLKAHYADGWSATAIASVLNRGDFTNEPHLTRNAVIGKIHRLGLGGTRRVKVARAAKTETPKPGNRQPTMAKIPMGEPAMSMPEPGIADQVVGLLDTIAAEDADGAPRQRVTLLDLDSTNCHWPIGDVQSPDFHFCGSKAWGGGPYCAHHYRKSIAPHYVRARDRSI